MRFKNFNDYKAQREKLLGEAQSMLNEGETENYDNKIKEIEDLDAGYADYAEKQANITALQDAVKIPAGLLVSDNNNITELENDYRKCFMNYVLKGIPLNNVDSNTITTDVGAVIPNTIMNRIVERMEKSGNILAKVTRTFYKGGVTIPTSSAKPTATWTTESGTTDKQKKTVGAITFTYFKLKVQISMSIIVENVTMDIFEQTLAKNIAEAITKALESAIINGSGVGQPKGILAENVVLGQNVDIAANKKIKYEDICKAESVLPEAYDNVSWCMRKSTFVSEIIGMTDTVGQPIGRVNAGINGGPEYTILGRRVEFSDDVKVWSDVASEDTVVAFMFRFEDYMLNTNMGVTVSRYTDQDTDDEITKAIMLADGKVVDKNSLVTMTKKKA